MNLALCSGKIRFVPWLYQTSTCAFKKPADPVSIFGHDGKETNDSTEQSTPYHVIPAVSLIKRTRSVNCSLLSYTRALALLTLLHI